MAVREVLLIPKTIPVGAHDPAGGPSFPSSSQVLPPTATPKPLPVLALRRILREFFSRITQEADGDFLTPEEARVLLSEVRRLWDDTGPAFAKVVSREEARIYYRDTRRCPYCGDRGIFHDPGHGGGLV